MNGSGIERERLRQRLLLRALQGSAPAGAVQGWLGDSPARRDRGLAAYRANAGHGAERALAASFPTVQALMGEESFAAMARAFRHARPPRRGDLAWLGEPLPAFIADSQALAEVPYLADIARLDWAIARAEAAADAEAALQTLALLAQADPAELLLQLMPGTARVASAFPVVTIWQAHQVVAAPGEQGADRFARAREALQAGRAEDAIVWRSGWRAQVAPLSRSEAVFCDAVLAGRPLGQALAAAFSAPAGFDFEAWLVRAVEQHWLCAVLPVASSPSEALR